MNTKDIEATTLRILRDWVPSGVQINRHDKLVENLGLYHDATDMALELEQTFQVRIPTKEWLRVYTVQDTIDLMLSYVQIDTE